MNNFAKEFTPTEDALDELICIVVNADRALVGEVLVREERTRTYDVAGLQCSQETLAKSGESSRHEETTLRHEASKNRRSG